MIAHPNQIGRYEIIREIARSMDVVYEAWDPVSQTRVAVKQLNVAASAPVREAQVRQSRFEREAQVAASLAHPNIVAIIDFGQEGGCPFLVMELVEAPTLAQLLDQRGLLHPDQVAAIAEQLLATIKYAHTKGVIHRDIKPQNLFVLPDGSIKLADFGISSVLTESTFAATGELLGTLFYMSPEQANGSRVDAKADLWAIGVVLFQSLTGTRPFEGASMVETLQRIISAQVNWPPTIDAQWRSILEKALARDPAERFQNAGEMLKAVQRRNIPVPIIKQAAPTPMPPIPVQPRSVQHPRPIPRQTQRQYSLVGVLFGMLALCFLAIIWSGRPRTNADLPPAISVPNEEVEVRRVPTSPEPDNVQGSTEQRQRQPTIIDQTPTNPPALQKDVSQISQAGNSETHHAKAVTRRNGQRVRSATISDGVPSYTQSHPVAQKTKPPVNKKSSPEDELPRPPKVLQSKESDSIGHI